MCRRAAAIARAVVAFLDAVLVECLRSCFRARPRRGSGRRDALVRRDLAAEVVWDGEQGLVRIGGSHEDLVDCGGIDKRELRREANYLKLCGTISETPAELRNEHENNLENTNECDNKPTCGAPTYCKSLFEANSSEGCEEHHLLISDLNTEDTRHLNEAGLVTLSAFLEKSPFQNIQHKPLDCSGSPFPTPLVLRDDMQTPGTSYASHRGASISGKCVRTRKQFIYPVLRPIENILQQIKLTEDSSPLPSSSSLKGRNLEVGSIKDPMQTSSNSVVLSGLPETPSSFSASDANASYQAKEIPDFNSDEKNAALSLSHWLKPSSTGAENKGDVECSFPVERPVFMPSDLNLDTDKPTPRLPKKWDGNGIPNTTTRYKEDQRVSWHTTPFEARLLKVLSDEEGGLPRKVVRGELFHTEEKAE